MEQRDCRVSDPALDAMRHPAFAAALFLCKFAVYEGLYLVL